MGTVYSTGGLKLKVHANDHQPPHCHAYKAGAEAIFDLNSFECLGNAGFSEVAIRKLQKLIAKKQEKLKEAWDEYHR